MVCSALQEELYEAETEHYEPEYFIGRVEQLVTEGKME